MIGLRLLHLGLFGLFATLGLLAVAGCSSESLARGDGGAADHPVVGDPAACGCQLDGYSLTISWSCFCASHDCAPQYDVQCAQGVQRIEGCGLVEYAVETIGGPERWVYDSSGTLVGEQLGTDDGEFVCPTDPSLIGFQLRAGKFPDGCDGTASCVCNPDGGCGPAADAGRTINPF